MKALTLHQPWATLVALGVKSIETRSWTTSHRGPIAIHAARTMPREARMAAYDPIRRRGRQGLWEVPDDALGG